MGPNPPSINPELIAVLQTLSTFAPSAVSHTPSSPSIGSNFNGSHPSSNIPSTYHQVQSSQDGEDNDKYEPLDIVPSASSRLPEPVPTSPTIPQLRAGRLSSTAKPSEGLNLSASSDPSSITTWPVALKYVMRTVAQNETLQAKVRRLIQGQHQHEKQWWQGRKALLAKQQTRAQKKKQLEDVLRSVGAPVSAEHQSTESAAKENKVELECYDAKVHKAAVEMAKALESELRTLRIPFFALKSSLIATTYPPNTSQIQTQPKDAESISSDTPASTSISSSAMAKTKTEKEPLPRTELLALQRRMLDLLQDLCRD